MKLRFGKQCAKRFIFHDLFGFRDGIKPDIRRVKDGECCVCTEFFAKKRLKFRVLLLCDDPVRNLFLQKEAALKWSVSQGAAVRRRIAGTVWREEYAAVCAVKLY